MDKLNIKTKCCKSNYETDTNKSLGYIIKCKGCNKNFGVGLVEV